MSGGRRIGTALVVASLALAAGLGPALGVTFLPKSFAELVDEADEIFVGGVAGLASRQTPAGTIVTDVTFSKVEVIKGDPGVAERTLVVLGGRVGDQTLVLPGVPSFLPGVTYLVFSRGNGTSVFPVVGGDQGLYEIRSDPATGERLAFGARGQPVSRMGRGPATPGVGPTLAAGATLTLRQVLDAVRDRLPSR